MRFVRFALATVGLVILAAARAQPTVPALTQPIPAQALSRGGNPVAIEVRNYFSVPGVTGQLVQFETVVGRFNIELFSTDAPLTVANFLNYVSSGRYRNTFIHRAVTDFVIQGGGYTATVPFAHIPTFDPVQNEFKLSNVRGTLSMAKQGGNPNSATSEWFVNLADNRSNLDNQNGGFTVFARVIGTGMTVVDAIAALPRFKIGFDDSSAAVPASTPLRNVPANETQLRPEYYVTMTDVKTISLFPSASGASALTVSADSSTPGIVTASVSGSTLTLTPVGAGSASVTVRVTDTNGNSAENTFAVNVASGAPVFTAQPVSQTVAAGSTVVFNAPATNATSFRWERNGQTIADATSDTLVIGNVTAARAGSYVAFATGATGTVQSTAATLTVTNLAATEVGRLVNLSILTSAGAGAKVLTMGAVIGPGDAIGALPLIIRAVGPTLGKAPFNIPGVLPDPVMTFFAAGNSVPIDGNDNWGGSATLSAAFKAVGAFDLPAASLDSAIARTTPGAAPGGYTVQVTGKGDATGQVIAEVYDASGATRTATAPRLINLSTRAEIEAGTDLAVGFVLGGQSARTVLVRGVGPSLATFGVTGLMADPKLELFSNNTGQKIASNDDWSGNAQIASVAVSVGAFAYTGSTSKDAALLVTLPPGPYTARISGVGGTGGSALVEVYEVP